MPTIAGLLKRLGGPARQWAWDREFRRGAAFVGPRSPKLCQMLNALVPGKRIVEETANGAGRNLTRARW